MASNISPTAPSALPTRGLRNRSEDRPYTSATPEIAQLHRETTKVGQMTTAPSTTATVNGFSADDIAEYQRRVGRLRDLLREFGYDGFIASDYRIPPHGDGYDPTPPYARYYSSFTLLRSQHFGPRNAAAIVPISGDLSIV